MTRDRAPCLRCGSEVAASARNCRACGYDVGVHDRARWWLGPVGMAMTLTLVLAPVGLPMLWLANRHRLAVAGTVTRRAERALLGQLSAVLRFHLGLAREPDVDRLLGSGAGRDPFDRQHGAR